MQQRAALLVLFLFVAAGCAAPGPRRTVSEPEVDAVGAALTAAAKGGAGRAELGRLALEDPRTAPVSAALLATEDPSDDLGRLSTALDSGALDAAALARDGTSTLAALPPALQAALDRVLVRVEPIVEPSPGQALTAARKNALLTIIVALCAGLTSGDQSLAAIYRQLVADYGAGAPTSTAAFFGATRITPDGFAEGEIRLMPAYPSQAAFDATRDMLVIAREETAGVDACADLFLPQRPAVKQGGVIAPKQGRTDALIPKADSGRYTIFAYAMGSASLGLCKGPLHAFACAASGQRCAGGPNGYFFCVAPNVNVSVVAGGCTAGSTLSPNELITMTLRDL
jgi:hypothetical protein